MPFFVFLFCFAFNVLFRQREGGGLHYFSQASFGGVEGHFGRGKVVSNFGL